MDNELMILLTARLNEAKSIQSISSQMANIQKGLASLKISLDLGDFKTQLEKTFGEFEKVTKKMNTSTNASGITNEMDKYRKSIADVTHEYKLGLKTQTEYIDAMQKAVFNSDGGYSSDFLSLEMKEQERLVKDINVAVKERDQALKTEYTTQVTIGKELEKQEKAYATIEGKKERLKEITVSHGNYDVNEYSGLIKNLDELERKLKNNEINVGEFRTGISKLNPKIKQFETNAKQASNTTNDLSDKLTRFVQFYVVGEALRQTKALIRDMVEDIKLLDSSLVELQKVSDLSGESLKSFTHEAFILGESVAKTGAQVIDATTVFKRAGFDISESLDLSKSALIMTSVAENIKNVEDASDSMIAVMRGYGFETSKATHIVDAFNEVSNTQAINFDQLADGATRLSGIMNQQGVSFERTLGLITGGTEVLRNVERVSTGIRTLSLRISGLSEDTEQATEESTKLVAKMGDEFERLAGIKLTDTNGQMRDTYSILGDMARVFPTLNKNTQLYLSQLAGGIRSSSVLQAIVGNWENVEKATKSALNSQGSSMKEMEAYLNSIEGKTNQLKSAMQSLSTTTINSDFVKGVIDATTAVVKLIDSLGGLVPMLTVIGGLLTIIKASAISETILAIGSAFSVMTKAVVGGSAAMTAAGATTMAFVPIAGAIAIAIAGVVIAINHISKSAERAQQKVETLKTELSDIQADTSSVSALGEQYDALAQLKKESGLNNEEQREFTRIQNELKDLLPTVNGYYNDQGDFIIDASESMETFNKEMKEYLGYKKEELAIAATDVLSGNIKRYKKEAEELEKLSKYHELYNKQINEGLTDAEGDMMGDLQRDLGLPIDVIVEKLKDVKESYNDAKDTIHDNIRDIIKNTDAWKVATEEQRDAMLRFLSEQDGKKLGEWAEQVKDGEGAANNFTKELSKMPDVINYANETLEQSANGINNVQNEFTSLEEAQENVSKAFKDTTKDIETLDNTMAKLREGKVLSKTEVLNLVDAYDISMDSIEKVTGGYKIEEGALESLRKTKIDSIKASIEAEQRMSDAVRDATNSRLKAFGVEIQGLEDLARARGAIFSAQATMGNQAKKSVTDKYGSSGDSGITAGLINTEYERLLEQQGLTKESINLAKKGLDEYEKSIKEVEESKKRLSLLEADSGKLWSVPSDKKKKSSSDSLIQGYNEEKRLLDAINESLKAQDNIITLLETKKNRAQEEGNLQAELNLHKQIVTEQEKKTDLYESQQIALSNLRQKMVSDAKKQFNVDISTMTNSDLENKFNQLYAGKTTKASKEQSDAFKQMMSNWSSLNDMDFKLGNDIENAHAELKTLVDTKWDIEVNIRDNNPQIIANKETIKSIEQEIQLISGNSAENDQKKLEKQRELVNALSSEKELAQGNIAYYREQLSLVSETSLEYRKINSLIDQSNDKLHETNVKLMESNRQLSEYIRKELRRSVESSVYGRGGRNSWEDASNSRINSLKDELEALREIDEVQKEREDREKRLLEIEKTREKLANLRANKTIQQYTKDKDGRWQWEYVADMVEIDKTQKELYEKEQDHLRKEEELDKKYKIKDIERQIKHEEEQAKIRREAYDRMNRDLNEAMDEQSSIFEMSGDDVYDIVSNSLEGLRGLYNGKFDDIIDDLQSKMKLMAGIFDIPFGDLGDLGSGGGAGSGGGFNIGNYAGTVDSNGWKEMKGESGKGFSYNTRTGMIIVKRPDGTQSMLSPGNKGYDETIMAMDKDVAKMPEGNGGSSSGGSGSSSSGSSGSGSNSSSSQPNKEYFTGNTGKQYGVNNDNGNIMVNRPDGTSSIVKPGDANYNATKNAMEKDKPKFKDGGQTSTTGWHWLDGEVGEPEEVLSADNTKAFRTLVSMMGDAIPNMKSFNELMRNMTPQISMGSILKGISITSSKGNTGEKAIHNYYDKLVFPNVKDGNDIIKTFKDLAFLADKI